MPRYNLNHQDIETIVNGLNYLAINAHSIPEHTRINNLKSRLLSKLNPLNPDPEDDQMDVWSAFQGDK